MGTKEKKAWYFIGNLKGDKVIWSILLLLMLLSLLFVFSSTIKKGEGASLATIMDQVRTVIFGIVAVIIVYNLPMNWIQFLSRWGFLFSVASLIALFAFGEDVNESVRYIKIGSLQVHVLEMVKVAILMYIAWVADAFEKKKVLFFDKLVRKIPKLQKPIYRKLFYLYIPFITTVVMVMKSSNTTAMFLALIMMITIGIVTKEYKTLLTLAAVLFSAVAIMFGIYQGSVSRGDNPPACRRIGTAISRIVSVNDVKNFKEATNPAERYRALDKIRQPYSARIAIHQGKFLGKGPGQSTQKYVVPIMAEDYMFSFIIEEYGWLLSLFVLALYLSLVARGQLVIRSCGTNTFAIATIFGLVLLISGQAFIHIFVNMDFGLLTGQTLPMLSHGSFAFLCFSVAFGIILNISKVAAKGMEKMKKDETPIMAPSGSDSSDEVRESLEDLDNYDL